MTAPRDLPPSRPGDPYAGTDAYPAEQPAAVRQEAYAERAGGTHERAGAQGVRPRDTPNPATRTVPQRSSTRVAGAKRKGPLAWLPIAALAALALLAALVLLVVNAVDDDGPDGPAGDSLGQVSGSDGSGINGDDEASPGQAGAGASGSPSGGAAPADPATAIAGLSSTALVGGAGVAPGPAQADAATAARRSPGTAGTVLFAPDSAELDDNAQQVVARAAETLRAGGITQVEVVGYTDVVAGAPVNQPLSQERADNTARALKALLPQLTVTTSARGQDDPVATNDTDEGRQQNRRAAIIARG